MQEMTAEALRIFEKASLNMAWYNRLVENREVIAEQLDAMAYIMEDCAKKQKNITEECRSNLHIGAIFFHFLFNIAVCLSRLPDRLQQ